MKRRYPRMLLAGLLVLARLAAIAQTAQSVRDADRGSEYYNSAAAAESATEKVLAQLSADFLRAGEPGVIANLPAYTNLVPSGSDNTYWTNYSFIMPTNGAPGTWVGKISPANAPYAPLAGEFPGLSGYASIYRIASRAELNGSLSGTNAAVFQDIQLAQIPIFQFAIFYNSPLEFTGAATFTIGGRVHCNTNIDVGPPSGATLTFNYFVTCTGIITNPPLAGLNSTSYTGRILYNGTPPPGFLTGEPQMILPFGTNNFASSAREIINPPPAGESITNPISSQRFYNQGDIVVWASNNTINVTLRSTPQDSSPLVFTNGTAAWTNAGLSSWVGTNSGSNAFYDARQAKYVRTVQIDVGHLGAWLKTNSSAAAKWSWASANPFNGVMYVGNFNDTNSAYLDAVRLTNGLYIDPSTNAMPLGLTVATANPLYIQGNFNATNYSNNFNYLGSSNVAGLPPASMLCDAITMLSPSWNDANSTGTYNCSSRNASSMTVNAAILAGNVATTGSRVTTYSGGVQNFNRLLENWDPSGGQQTLTLNTSIVCVFGSAQATNQFVQPTGTPSTDYYEPPVRHFYFNANYSSASGLPPGTPELILLERVGQGVLP